jgi:hypothetical protein
MLLKLGSEVDPHHVLGHKLGQMIGVIGVNQSFYCARSKNNIILIKKIMTKKKSMGFDMTFSKLIA